MSTSTPSFFKEGSINGRKNTRFSINIKEGKGNFSVHFYDSTTKVERRDVVSSTELVPRMVEETCIMFPYLEFYKEYLILDRSLIVK